jgi:signal peptidase I
MLARPPKTVVIGIVLVATLLIGLIVRAKVFDWYRIPQNGMSPGLPAGSLFFVNKLAYSAPADVQRGDVVVFDRVQDGKHYTFVWRVIGLPGEAVEASGETLNVNGEPIQRKQLREEPDRVIYHERIGDAEYEVAYDRLPGKVPPDVQLTVPPDQFFLMGDNRYGALDSRMTGTVAFTAFLGKKL